MGTSHPHLLQSPQKFIKDQAGIREPGLGLASEAALVGSICLSTQEPWRRICDPRVWKRKWRPSPVFLPEASHGRRAWRATVHEVAKSLTQLSDWAGYGPRGGKESDTTEWLSSKSSRFESWANQLTILSLSFLNLQMWLNNGDLRKLVTIKWNHAHEAVRVTGTECFTQQMKSAFIVAVIIFSAWTCVAPGELARGGRGQKQPTPPAGWQARRYPGSRACWAPHLEERPF